MGFWRRLVVFSWFIIVLAACGGTGEASEALTDEVPEALALADLTYDALARHCGIENPVVGQVMLFSGGPIEFVVEESAVGEPNYPLLDPDALVRERTVCLQSVPTDAVGSCGVVQWNGEEKTVHATVQEFVPTLFSSESVEAFEGTPTRLFAQCPGDSGDETNPLLFGSDISLKVERYESLPRANQITNTVSRVLSEHADLANPEPLTSNQCTTLDTSLGHFDAIHSAARALLGSPDELAPREVVVDPTQAVVLEAAVSQFRDNFSRRPFDDTTVYVAATELGFNTNKWELLAMEVSELDAVPVELHSAWVQWRLGAHLGELYFADSEATVTHLRRVHETRCSGVEAPTNPDPTQVCESLDEMYRIRLEHRQSGFHRDLRDQLSDQTTAIKIDFPASTNPFFNPEDLDGVVAIESIIGRNYLDPDDVAAYDVTAQRIHEFALANCPAISPESIQLSSPLAVDLDVDALVIEAKLLGDGPPEYPLNDRVEVEFERGNGATWWINVSPLEDFPGGSSDGTVLVGFEVRGSLRSARGNTAELGEGAMFAIDVFPEDPYVAWEACPDHDRPELGEQLQVGDRFSGFVCARINPDHRSLAAPGLEDWDAGPARFVETSAD